MTDRIGVVFVCLGNICRSPLAEGSFRAHVEAAGLADRFLIDSAGTGHWHVGESPDPRSVAVARHNSVDISRQRGRQFGAADFARFAHIVAMDGGNRRDIVRQTSDEAAKARVTLLLDEVDGFGAEVPDPYYGGKRGFEKVWQMVDAATAGLLERLTARYDL